MTALTPIHALECKLEGSAAAFCFIQESSCSTGESAGAAKYPLLRGLGWLSAPVPGPGGLEQCPSPGKLKTLQKKYLKVVHKPFDFAPRIGGGSNGQLDLKGLVKKNP